MPPDPHVAIAVLNYNGAALLQEYLPTLLSCSYSNFSLYIIDNASQDNSELLVKEKFPGVKWIQNGRNAGFAAGYNLGLAHIDAEYYLIINSDVRVVQGFLQPLVETLQQFPLTAAVQPKILWERNPDKFEYAGGSGGYIDALGYPFCRGRILSQLEKDEGQYQEPSLVFWTSGACMLVRSAAFHQLGGFYSYMFMHQEEIDLCWRMQLAGFECRVEPTSVVYHLGGATLESYNPDKTYYNFRNNLVMLSRNAAASRMLWLAPTRFLLDLMAALHYMANGKSMHAVAVLKGWLGFTRWLFTQGNAGKNRKPMRTLHGVYMGSLLWSFYVRQKKKWSALLS